ncbi:MAG: cytochrome c [Gallionella sp.]
MSRVAIGATMALGLLLGTLNSALAGDGKQTFEFYCAQCHGVKGDGKGVNVGPDFPVDPRNFTDAKEMSKRTDTDIRGVIKDGGQSISKSPLMPPWGATLSDAQLDDLVAYIRTMCKCKAN